MNELEEKKTVAKWMGWKHQYGSSCYSKTKGNGSLVFLQKWNPQSDELSMDIWWQELYGNMNGEDEPNYYSIIMGILGINKYEIDFFSVLELLQAKPKVRWAALLQMIGEKK